jgi:MFS superfamily sulfate permease-like transporter
MADASGGRTQVTGLIAAATVAVVLLYLTEPLRFVPIAALGAVLIKASLSLLDLQSLKEIYRLDRRELALSLLATLGVIWVGAIQAILVAVVLALLRFIRVTSRPRVEVLGEVEGLRGFHSKTRHETAKSIRGLVLFRFNAPCFKHQARLAMEAAGPELRWFVRDTLPLTQLDVTGYYELENLSETLRAQGAELALAGRLTETSELREARGLGEEDLICRHFPTLRQAVRAYRTELAPRADAVFPAVPGTADQSTTL